MTAAWFCRRCQRILFGTPEHACVLVSFKRPSKSWSAELPKVGVPHILSVRKWCEL